MVRTWPSLAILAGAGLILAPQLTRPGLTPLRADADCGPLALMYICQTDGKSVSLADLKQRIPTTATGTNLLELKRAAESLGYTPEGLRLPFAALRERLSANAPAYAILHVGGDHFIAVVGLANDGRLQVRGLPDGTDVIGEGDLQRLDWDGVALVMRSAAVPPLLVFEPDRIDLGRVPKGTEKPFKIKVTNPGSADVKIARIDAGCGCIRVGVGNPIIPAHGSDFLTGAFRAGEPGNVRRQVQVYTQVPAKAVFSVEMVGEVFTTIRAQPEVVELRPDWYNGKGSSSVVRVTNNSDRDIDLTTRPLSDLLTVTPKRARLEQSKSIEFTVSIPAEVVTAQRLQIALDTSHPTESTIVVPVQVIPAQEIKIVPSSIHLGVATKKELLQRGPISLALSGPGSTNLSIDKIDTPVFLEVFKNGPANSSGLVVSFRIVDCFTGFAPTGQLVLHLKSTDRQSARVTVSVPVSGLIKKGP